MRIINLTQHQATPEQMEAGVFNTTLLVQARISQLLTFDYIPSAEEMTERAFAINCIAVASGADAAMIGGAPFFMYRLATALKNVGIQPLFAFSKRESEEQAQPDGSVRKVAVFRHIGFVPG